MFDRVLELKPENWSALWIAGKVHQRLGEDEAAFSFFERAYQANPSQPDCMRIWRWLMCSRAKPSRQRGVLKTRCGSIGRTRFRKRFEILWSILQRPGKFRREGPRS